MLASELLNQWPTSSWQHRKVLVGVSGGADSVALLCLLSEVVPSDRLVAAHYNHRWRDAASDADEAFVVRLCQHLGVACRVEHARAPQPSPAASADQNDSVDCVQSAMLAKMRADDSESNYESPRSEELARNARYEFLIRMAYETGASYVATAHTAEDRVETLLHNLFRGSGLAGAASLQMFRELDKDLVLVRPLIAKSRNVILQYLAAREQPYCTDASNADAHYARNYIRHQILPAVRVRYAGADASLLSFSELVEEALGDVTQLAERWLAATQADWEARLKEAASGNPVMAKWRKRDFWGAPLTALAEEPWMVVREALRLVWLERGWPLADMSRRRWQSLRTLIQSAAELPAADPLFHIPKTLAILPGALAVEAAAGYLAIGPAQGRQAD